MSRPFKRVILIVLDSVGVGAADDAHRFGDESAHTLGHISQWCEKNFVTYRLPHLSQWGLSEVTKGFGILPEKSPKAAIATMRELSPGKDTTTGHWEMAGTVLHEEFPVFEKGFDEEFLQAWCKENSLPGYLCNKSYSGTVVLDDFGEEHLRTGKPIVYTSGDSVFQIACHEERFGLDRLYQISKSARRLLDPLGVGRIIARPFLGEAKGAFKRTENRRDFSVPPPGPNLLDLLVEQKFFVAGIGKIEDIFAHRSVTIVEHTGRNETSLVATVDAMKKTQGQRGLIFTNLIDFDQLHGHRRNPKTYAEALMAFDNFLPQIEAATTEDDLVILTADHGNDPTHHGTDHTREKVPLLIWSPRKSFSPQQFGDLPGFATVARLCLDALGLEQSLAKLPDAQAAEPIFSKLFDGDA